MLHSHPIFLILDPENTAAETVLAHMAEQLEHKRQQFLRQGLDYERLVEERLHPGYRGTLGAALYAGLSRMNSSAEQLWVSPAVQNQNLPLFNRWWMRFKELFHALVVIYVNMLAGKQIVFNVATSHVLSDLVHLLEERESRLESIELELKMLREQLERYSKPSD